MLEKILEMLEEGPENERFLGGITCWKTDHSHRQNKRITFKQSENKFGEHKVQQNRKKNLEVQSINGKKKFGGAFLK